MFRMLLLRNSEATILLRRPPIQQRLKTRNRNSHDSSGHFEHTQNVCKNISQNFLRPSHTKGRLMYGKTYKQGSPAQYRPSA
jgi:hypothetical protein